MSDLGSSNWSETAASNTAVPPNGWPEGMLPAGVNNSAREGMGAEKRFWNRINAIKTTAGTTSAYTLTYDQAAAQYYDGEIHSFVVNATNAASATLNINGLGARQLRLFAGNLLPGALIADQVVSVRYNLAATAFDIIPQDGWVRLGQQAPSAQATVDFTGIPAAVNHLQCVFELRPSTDNVTIALRTYGADGVLDSGATDYNWVVTAASSAGVTSITAAAGNAINFAAGIDNGVFGFGGDLTMQNIQAATYTKLVHRITYFNQNGTDMVTITGGGLRAEADRITGIRFFVSAGTGTGLLTLFASS